MSRKQLKPGQLCTIRRHIFRCSKPVEGLPACIKCVEFYRERDCPCDLLPYGNDYYISKYQCGKFFGTGKLQPASYPILVKICKRKS